MRALTTKVSLVLVAAAVAIAGIAVAASRSHARHGVRHLSAPARLGVDTLGRRGLLVAARVGGRDRALRLRLLRPHGKRAVAAATFALRTRGRAQVRWRLAKRTVRRLRPGRYLLEARAGRRPGHMSGSTRTARLQLVARRALSSVPPASPSPTPAPPPVGPSHPSSARPCGTAAQAPPWQHVIWLVMENTGYTGIVGSPDAPYLNGLAARCGSATSFFAEGHPSLPNYIAMTSGSTQGITDDAAPSAHPLGVASIFSQLGADWRALQESMPSNCPRTTSGLYAVKHDPAAYYTNIPCATQDVPLGDPPDVSARFTFITPNQCNDMHDCSVAKGDAWLSQWVPKLLDSPQYQGGATALFITWDEDDGSQGNHIATFVIAPSTPPGTQGATRFDHYSMLRTTEEMLGLPATLGAAAGAPSMRVEFHL